MRQAIEIIRAKVRRGDELDIFLHRAPGQQARLLEHESDAHIGGVLHLADEAVIELSNDP